MPVEVATARGCVTRNRPLDTKRNRSAVPWSLLRTSSRAASACRSHIGLMEGDPLVLRCSVASEGWAGVAWGSMPRALLSCVGFCMTVARVLHAVGVTVGPPVSAGVMPNERRTVEAGCRRPIADETRARVVVDGRAG